MIIGTIALFGLTVGIGVMNTFPAVALVSGVFGSIAGLYSVITDLMF